MMKVTYLGHSGFLVEMDDVIFLFDYYKGELPEMDPGKKLLVFVSHAHYDHYRKEIFSLREHPGPLCFILSSDVTAKTAPDIVFMKPNEEREILGCRIRTLRSTDEGVAYLLKYGGKTIYHAGDLNWWHWEGETEAYNTAMRRAYQAEINARKALRCALDKSNPEDLYCIDENNELIGPLFRENELRYQLISNDPRVMELAEKTGLSSASILKLRAIIDMRHSDVFDAHELADCLEVTTRSARRIISRLIEAGCGEVYAKENAASRGRPKSLVRILLGSEPSQAGSEPSS